jgi:hypothetical protein
MIYPDNINIPDFVAAILEDIVDSGSILSAIDNGDGTYTCTVNDTGRLKDYYVITIDNVNYTVTNVTSTSFKITIASDPSGKNWETYILFFYGDPINIQNDLRATSGSQKNPVVALYEPTIVNYNNDATSPVYTTARLWMAFMKPYSDSWSTSVHYDKAIDPMNFLSRDFLKKLEECEGGKTIGGAKVHTVNGFQKIQHHQYGLWERSKGHKKQMLEKVSGVELVDLEIQFKKKYTC